MPRLMAITPTTRETATPGPLLRTNFPVVGLMHLRATLIYETPDFITEVDGFVVTSEGGLTLIME